MKTSNDAGEKIRGVCLRLLARREHSRQELRRKLQTKDFADETVDAVIDELAEQGWQDDNRFAESYARQRLQQGFGPVAIGYQLRQKGVENFDVDSLACDWMDLLVQTYRKKYADDSVIGRTEWAKRYRFLLQRGFPAQMINDLPRHLSIKLS